MFSSIGAVSLLLLGLPIGASAATESVTDAPVTVPITVDKRFEVRDFIVTAPGLVDTVTVTVDFGTHDGANCAVPSGVGDAFPDELDIVLTSPSDTRVQLVSSWYEVNGASYPDFSAVSGRYVVTFDDDAIEIVGNTNGGVPIDGVFQGEDPLSSFHGELAQGTWQLSFRDTDLGDAKCYYGATLNISTVLIDAEAVLTATPSTVEIAEEVLLEVSVGDATGTVEFFYGTESLGVAPVVDGIATLPASFEEDGTHQISATYSGDTNHNPATSETIQVTVLAPSIIDPPIVDPPVVDPPVDETEVPAVNPTPPAKVDTARR